MCRSGLPSRRQVEPVVGEQDEGIRAAASASVRVRSGGSRRIDRDRRRRGHLLPLRELPGRSQHGDNGGATAPRCTCLREAGSVVDRGKG